jgi:kanamycin kinase
VSGSRRLTWQIVTAGRSGATVARRGGLYRKTSDDPSHDLPAEGARLSWLRDHGIPAAEVVECRPGLLVTAEVPGRSAAEPWPEASRPRVVDALAEIARTLHSLPVADCPFDRRLAVVIPPASAARLLSDRPPHEDLVVCHGDLCLPNVLLDPATVRVTGLIDAGLLGVADRWADLALATRSLSGGLNPQYGAWAADRFLSAYGIAPDPEKEAFYRMLTDFF